MKSVSIKLLLFTFIMCLLSNINYAQGGNSAKNLTNKMNITSFNKYLPNATVDSGYFVMRKSEGAFCIEMADELRRNKQQYMIVNCFDTDDLILSDNTATIKRKSGILKFESDSQNTGDFTFLKNPDFVQFLKDEGVKLDNDLYYFKLFLGDIDNAYVLDIKKLGYQPTITELGRLVWHDAGVTYIKEIGSLLPSLNLNEISLMSAHNISTKYLQELIDLGIEEMDFSSIKKAKLIGITPQMIEAQKRLGNSFTDLNSYLRLIKKKKG